MVTRSPHFIERQRRLCAVNNPNVNVVNCKVCFYIKCLALLHRCIPRISLVINPSQKLNITVQRLFSEPCLDCSHHITHKDKQMIKHTNGCQNTFPKKCFRMSMLTALLSVSILGGAVQAETQPTFNSSIDTASFSEGYALSVEDGRTQTRSASANASSNFHHQTQNRPQVWINNIGTLLFDDHDGDGYHSGFSVTMDVDSEFGDTEVYAKIYLEPSGMSSVLLHTTERFSIYGTTIGDEYRVDTELRNNYEADTYNVSIDIHDAWSDVLLDTANERGFTNLRQLPLESSDLNQHAQHGNHFDVVDEPDDFDDHDHDNDDQGAADVVVTEYAGLFHPLLLLGLACGALLRQRMR